MTPAEGPLISLVMPAWRPRPDWLLAAVRSALDQRGCRIELVVVDDGSPSPVAEALASVDDPRIRVLCIEHGGVSRARNAGVEAARGDLVRYVDSDDVYPPDSTARLLALTGPGQAVVAYGATLFCDERLRPVWRLAARRRGDLTEALLLGRQDFRVQSMLFPRAVLEDVGPWDPAFPVSGDWDYVLRASECAPFRPDPEVATYYRDHGGVTADYEAGLDAARRVVDRYFARHPRTRDTGLPRRTEAMLQALAARVYATHGRPRHAVGPLLRAARTDPRALASEARRGLPALTGLVRNRLRAPGSRA